MDPQNFTRYPGTSPRYSSSRVLKYLPENTTEFIFSKTKFSTGTSQLESTGSKLAAQVTVARGPYLWAECVNLWATGLCSGMPPDPLLQQRRQERLLASLAFSCPGSRLVLPDLATVAAVGGRRRRRAQPNDGSQFQWRRVARVGPRWDRFQA
eukprot:SAG11_NODE_4220_length_2005_cov_1.769150_1_plen_152_part_10